MQGNRKEKRQTKQRHFPVDNVVEEMITGNGCILYV